MKLLHETKRLFNIKIVETNLYFYISCQTSQDFQNKGISISKPMNLSLYREYDKRVWTLFAN